MAFESIKNKFPIRFTVTDGGLVTPNTLNALSHLSYVILSMVMDSIFMPLNDRGYGIVGARDISAGTRVDKYQDFQVEASLNNNNTLTITVRKGVSSYSLARLGKFSDGIYKDLPRYAVLSRDITKTISNVSSTQYYVYITSPVESAFQDGSEFSASPALFPAQYLPANAANSPIVRGLEITEDSIVVSTTLPNSGYLLLAEVAIRNGVAEVKDKREFLIPKIPYYSVDNYSIFKNATETPEKDNPFIPLHRAIDNVVRYAWALPYLSPSSLFRKGIEKVNRIDIRSNIYFLKPTRVDNSQIALDLTFPDSWEENIVNVGGLAYRHNRNSNVPIASSLLDRLDVGTENSNSVYFYIGTDSNGARKLYCKIPKAHLESSNFKLLNGSGVPTRDSYVILGLALLYNPATDLFTPAWVFLPEYNGGINYNNNVFAVAPQKMYDGNFNLYSSSREYYPLFGLPGDSLLDYVSNKTNCTICLNRSRFTPNDTYGRGLYNSIFSLAFANTKVHGVGPSYVSEGLDRLSALLIAIVGIKLSKSTDLSAEIAGIFKNQNNIQYDTSSTNAGVEDQRTFGILFAQDIRIEPRGGSNYVSFDLSSDYPMKNLAKLTDYSLRDYIEDLDNSIVLPPGDYPGFPTQPPYGKKIPALYNDPKYGETIPEKFLSKYLVEFLSRPATLTVILERDPSDLRYITPSEFKTKMTWLKEYLNSAYYTWTSGPIIIDIIAKPIRRTLGSVSVYTTEGAVRYDSNSLEQTIDLGNLPDHRQIILRFGVGLHFTSGVRQGTITFKFYKSEDKPVNPTVIISNLLVTRDSPPSGSQDVVIRFLGCSNDDFTQRLTTSASVSVVNSYFQSSIKVIAAGNNVFFRNISENPYQSITYGGALEIYASNKVRVSDCGLRELRVSLVGDANNYNLVDNTVYIDRTVVDRNLIISASSNKSWREIRITDFRKEWVAPSDEVRIENFEVLSIDRSHIKLAKVYIKGRDGDGRNEFTMVYISNSLIRITDSPGSQITEVQMCRIDNSFFTNYGTIIYTNENVEILRNIKFLHISNSTFYFRIKRNGDCNNSLIKFVTNDTQEEHIVFISSSSLRVDFSASSNLNKNYNFYILESTSDKYKYLLSSSRLIINPVDNSDSYNTQIFEVSVSDGGYIACVGCLLKAKYIVHSSNTTLEGGALSLDLVTDQRLKIPKAVNIVSKY